jgi:hypothetical protein
MSFLVSLLEHSLSPSSLTTNCRPDRNNGFSIS